VNAHHFRKSKCESFCDLGLRVRPRLLRIVTIVTIACTLPWGCGRAPTIWSASSESPDGNWVAVAHTDEYTGPGANSVETIVEIKELKGNRLFRHSERVLGFLNDGATINLKMNWVSPSRLEVEFTDDPKMGTRSSEPLLYYEVVRTSGVEISVRDLYKPPGSSQ